MQDITIPAKGSYLGETLVVINGQAGNAPALYRQDASVAFSQRAQVSVLDSVRTDNSDKRSIKIKVPTVDSNGLVIGSATAIIQIMTTDVADTAGRERCAAIINGVLADVLIEGTYIARRQLHGSPFTPSMTF